MKKLVSCLGVVFVLIAAFSNVTYAFASTPFEEESDVVFFQTLNEIVAEEGKVTMQNEITKEVIYDMSLEPLGYIYFIAFESSAGYALVINTNGIFEVTEIYLDSSNPYNNYSGQKIYAGLFLYLIWDGINYIEPQYGNAISAEVIDEISKQAFYAADNSLYQSREIVYYTNRVQNEYGLAKRHPAYIPVGITNGCTPAAGGNIVGYYTRFFPELIPGFTPGSTMGNYYLYKDSPVEADAVIQKLYNYMGTNTTEPGTSIEGFRNGMTRYCNEKGRNIGFTSYMQNGKLNFEIAKQGFHSGMPSVLFLDTFTVATLFNVNSSEEIDYFVGKVCHAMAGFGYNEITYNLTNGQVRKDTYIAVATGLSIQTKGYFNINFDTQIDEYYSINMY